VVLGLAPDLETWQLPGLCQTPSRFAMTLSIEDPELAHVSVLRTWFRDPTWFYRRACPNGPETQSRRVRGARWDR
jgi:hypothetical protein